MTLLTLSGEAPWNDFGAVGRAVHVIIYVFAGSIFGMPLGLFAGAFQTYIEQAYFAGAIDEDDDDDDEGIIVRLVQRVLYYCERSCGLARNGVVVRVDKMNR